MTDRIQPEALRLADLLDANASSGNVTMMDEERTIAQTLRRLYAENATLQAGYDAARLEIDHLRCATKMMGSAGEYPQLPAPDFGRARRLGAAYYSDAYAPDQMRAYADATCAMRAQQRGHPHDPPYQGSAS